MKGKIIKVETLKIPIKLKKYEAAHEPKRKMETDRKANKKRKKKRKNESIEVSSEPEKKLKTEASNNVSEQSTTQNGIKENIDASDLEDGQETEITKEESNKFNGKFLRKAFNSADGVSTLQKFITICNQNNERDLAAEYLEAGGSVLEVLRLLDASEKKNLYNAATVFSAMHIVIIKILAKFPQNQSSAEEACRHFLNTHLASIHSMLASQSKVKHRKIVLKLLAALVSLGGTLPRELLNHLTLHSQLVEVLVSHSRPTDPQSVRTCFIHFILAFLIEGNASDIRAMLEKRGVLSSIFSGLLYDCSEVVQLVLTTAKKYILENPAISKTTKLRVFSTSVIQGIVNLYNWKGPTNWPGHKKQKPLTEHIDSEQKKITVNAVHEFLIVLLTSNRHGIAFHDRSLGTDSGYKHNQLISTILQSLEKPWEHDKPSELVVKILTSCPDLIKSQLVQTEAFLVPRVSKNWVAVIQFIRKIITNVNVESCLKLCTVDMTAVQLANAILNLTLPPIIIKNAITPSLENNSILIHHEIVNLVLTMMRKVENFMTAFESKNCNASEDSIFRNIVLDHIIKHLPSFDSILNMWAKAFSPDLETQIPDVNERDLHIELKDHLMAILNLLQAYSEIGPEILVMTSAEAMQNKPIILLKSLCNVQGIGEEELTIMKVKSLRILLSANISGFSPNEEIFGIALSFLMTKVGDKDASLDAEVRHTLNLLLGGCGIFEGYNDQIEIWIDGITYVENVDDKLTTAEWITKLVKRISKHTEKYISLIRKTEENTEEEMTFVNKQEDIFNELSERNIEDVKLIAPMLPVTSISLLLYAATENMRKSSDALAPCVAHYTSVVFTHLLHSQVSPRAFISLVEELKIPAQKYLTNWSTNDTPVPIKKPFDSKCVTRSVSKILLNPSEMTDVCITETQLCIQSADSVENYTLTKFEVKALLQMAMFYLTRLLQKRGVELQNIVIYEHTLSSLLRIANEMELDSDNLMKKCAKLIFKNPILLRYFNGIQKNDNTPEHIVTKLFMKICALFFDLNKQSLISQFMHPYQEKFIMGMKSAIKKHKDSNRKKEVNPHVELIDYLQLDIKVTLDLLFMIKDLPIKNFVTLDKSTLSVWAMMLPKLIGRFSTEEIRNESGSFITIDENVLKRLFCYLTELKVSYKQQMDLWENSFYDYLSKFPHNISAINEKIFIALLKTKLTLTTVKIINLLVERNPQNIASFIKYANSNEEILQEKSLVLSILSSGLRNKWNQEFLSKLYKCYKTDIVLFLTERKVDEFPWLRENVSAVAYLIENIFNPKLCKETCDVILSNGDKLDTVQEVHVQLFCNFFRKSTEVKSDALKDFCQLLLHIIVAALKKESKNIAKLNFYCKTLIESIDTLRLKNDFSFEELNKNHFWAQFIRINLKSGLKITKDDKTNFLLRALIATCDVAYKDNSNEEYVKTIFEMSTSHSEFINIMLSNGNVKSDLIELLWTLLKKNHSVMLATHIPLYLAAYNATLAASDQFILKILQHYEDNGIKLNDYRPYLWGSAAATHYSIKGETDTALWRQPSTSQVLDLLDPEMVANTIKNFPVKRSGKCDGASNTENKDRIYDPVFYLPVFTHLLAGNNVVACHKVIHSGALALTIVACSSECEQIRLAAFTVISRFYFHLEATSSKEKLMWINLIDILRNGIVRTELPLENIRLNGFAAIFLARTCFVLTQPLHPLYSPLQAFLMAKPALDMNTIPELLQLCHSSEIEHQAHRHWILEVICDGLKTDNDMDIASRCVLFKMLLDFYTSILSDKVTKNLVLQIVRSATKLTKPCMILVNGYALLPWLITVSENLHNGDVDHISCIIDIVNNILNVLRESKSKEVYYHLMLIKILLCLKSHFKQNLTPECLKTFVDVLNQSIINSTVSNAFTEDHMKDVIKFSKHLLQNVDECEAILQFGCKFVKRKNQESDRCGSPQDSLCKLIMTWHNYAKSGN